MPIRTVLSILSSRYFDEDLKAAAEFCEASGAHLSAVVICMGASPMMGEYNSLSTVWLEERQREIEELVKKAEEIKAYLSRTDLSYDVQDVYTEYAFAQEDVAERALYADVVLVGRQACKDEELQKRVMNGALFQTPTPVIINRGRRPLSSTSKSIVLAWDSSDEASRAARQALDLLKTADCVYVTMIDPVSRERVNGEEPGADIASFLSRHGGSRGQRRKHGRRDPEAACDGRECRSDRHGCVQSPSLAADALRRRDAQHDRAKQHANIHGPLKG